MECQTDKILPCVQGVGTPLPDDTERARLSGSTPSRFTKRDMWCALLSGYVYSEKLKCPPLPSCCEISGCKMSVHGIPDMKCRRTEFLPGWTELCCAKRDRLRVQGVGTPLLDDTECARLSGSTPSRFSKRARSAMLSGSTPFGFPQGEAHDTREHHTPDDSISYPDMLSGLLTSAAILSGHLCHGFQRTLLNL